MLQRGHTEQKDVGTYYYKQPVSVKWIRLIHTLMNLQQALSQNWTIGG